MKLVDDAHHAWKWLSTQALAVAGAAPLAWANLPHEWRDSIPAGWLACFTLVVSAIGIYGRITVTKADPQ